MNRTYGNGLNGRRIGRTLASVRKLQPGDAYVVPSAAMRQYVLTMMADLIDPALVQQVQVLIVRCKADLEAVEKQRGRVRIDHYVQEAVRWTLFQELLVEAERCNARQMATAT